MVDSPPTGAPVTDPTQPAPTAGPVAPIGGYPAASVATPAPESNRKIIIIAAVVALVVLALVVLAVIGMVRNPALTETIRDMFIIFMALEFIVIGVALVVLVYQLALITNMLRHEIKPILESTNETVNTVRGTTAFLSEHLVDPVIKLNANIAGITNVIGTLGNVFGRRGRK